MDLSVVLKKMHKIWSGFSSINKYGASQTDDDEEIDGRIYLATITYIKVSSKQTTTRTGEIYKIDRDKKGATLHYIDYDRGKQERSCKVKNILSIQILDNRVFPAKT